MRSARSSNQLNSDDGQATVELALAMPVVMVLLLAGVQVGLIVRDQLAVVSASRAAARAASIGGDPVEAASHAGLDPSRLSLTRATHDRLTVVTVRYRAPTDLPFVGLLVGDVQLEVTTTMALEPDT
jgi:Flp pilus assembly protein TadG